MQIAQKSVLAKLLATENISIEHRNVTTASFDLQNRKIILPIWQDMSNELYNLLIGHEVSHALNTPLDGWHDAACDRGANFKGFLNVIEDARIERQIKKQYPGLVKDFYAGYRELFAKGFFGENKDPQELSLIDRINLHYKIGNLLGISFTDAEKVYIDRIDNAETWEDVVAIAEDIYGEAQEEQEQEKQYNYDPDADEEADETETSDGESQESDDKSEQGNESDDSEETDEDTDEESEEEQTVEDNVNPDEPIAATDESFRENEKNLLKENANEIFYATFPTNIKSEKFVNSLSKVWDTEFEGCYAESRYAEESFDYKPFALARQKEFDNKNRAYINQMVQLFEMRRRASALSKSRENKTGALNMDKLWATRLTEDVFLSNTIVPDGKNHGMVLFLDFSGSMHGDMAATLEQVMVQIQFCKKVNIPFDVYSFTDGSRHYGRIPSDEERDAQTRALHGGLKNGTMYISDTRDLTINHLISSSCGSAQYKTIVTKMFALIDLYENYGYSHDNDVYKNRYGLPDHLGMGGTPLGAMTMLARNLVRDFKARNKVEVMNVIFLTDGDATDDLEITGQEPTTNRMRVGDKMVLSENGVTTVHENNCMYYNCTSDVYFRTLLKHMKATVDCNLINFHIGPFKKHNIVEMLLQAEAGKGYINSYDPYETRYKEEFLKHKFIEIENYNGFDTFYAIKNGDNLKIDGEELTVKSDSKGDLVRGFKKFQKNKSQNRVFLNKFIDKVA